MHMVYWTVVHEDGHESKSQAFSGEDISAPLKFMEELRKEQYETGKVRFIVMSSENPNCVGKAGVAVAGPEYNWEKRRGGSGAPSKGDLSRYKDH